MMADSAASTALPPARTAPSAASTATGPVAAMATLLMERFSRSSPLRGDSVAIRTPWPGPMRGRPARLKNVAARASDGSVQLTAAGKVLAVLGTFGRERPGQSLTQISQRAHLPLSTTHRIVTELAAWGALERTA